MSVVNAPAPKIQRDGQSKPLLLRNSFISHIFSPAFTFAWAFRFCYSITLDDCLVLVLVLVVLAIFYQQQLQLSTLLTLVTRVQSTPLSIDLTDQRTCLFNAHSIDRNEVSLGDHLGSCIGHLLTLHSQTKRITFHWSISIYSTWPPFDTLYQLWLPSAAQQVREGSRDECNGDILTPHSC